MSLDIYSGRASKVFVFEGNYFAKHTEVMSSEVLAFIQRVKKPCHLRPQSVFFCVFFFLSTYNMSI